MAGERGKETEDELAVVGYRSHCKPGAGAVLDVSSSAIRMTGVKGEARLIAENGSNTVLDRSLSNGQDAASSIAVTGRNGVPGSRLGSTFPHAQTIALSAFDLGRDA